MPLSDLTDPHAVVSAVAEYDRLGQTDFLAKYGFQPARTYVLVVNGHQYDSKAIVGAAYGYQYPDRGALKASDFSGGEQTVERLLNGLGFHIERREGPNPSEPPEPNPPFDPGLRQGDTLTNDELCEKFGCSTQGGMRRSLSTNTLVIVSNHVKSVYGDAWEDNVLHYTGMGLTGNQQLGFAQNKTLYELATNGVAVFLFEVFVARQYYYQGEVVLAATPYQATQADQDGHERAVWMFPLRLKDGTTSAVIPELLLTQTAVKRERKVRRLSDREVNQRARHAPQKARSRQVEANQYERQSIRRRSGQAPREWDLPIVRATGTVQEQAGRAVLRDAPH